MRKKGLTLLVVAILASASIFPLPECFFTKLNCPRRGTDACEVFAGKRQLAGPACGQACPLSQTRKDPQEPGQWDERLQKQKFYPVRSALNVGAERALIFAASMETAPVDKVRLRDGLSTNPANACERASPLFIQHQSFLI